MLRDELALAMLAERLECVAMSTNLAPKYPAEFILTFKSVDRFLFRVSDLGDLKELENQELLARLHDCHIYLIGKRPRISVVPDSVKSTDEVVRFTIEYKCQGLHNECAVSVPRNLFAPEEAAFEASPYPHRELVSRNSTGDIVAETVLANYAHLIPDLEPRARDLEVVYVGKGLRRSANDRLPNHATLQKILAHLHSNEPDAEVFALVYAFKYQKDALLPSYGVQPEISGDAATQHRMQVLAYKPSVDAQVSLIEASAIAYFQTEQFNKHYLNFPTRNQQILKHVYAADFAAILVELDNTNIGGQRVYSKKIPADSTHAIVVDFRRLEGKLSLIDAGAGGPRQ
jgi:hypothetical protein